MNGNVRDPNMKRITNKELADAFIEEQIKEIKAQVSDKKVLLALSGGVDSSVCVSLNIFVLLTAGNSRISTPALTVMHSISSSEKLSAIAPISSASDAMTPSNPISFLRMSVRIVLLIVAGRYTCSPVDTEV